MHKDFRLFAAQNPSTGLFAAHRMELPESLVSRFLTVNFDRLPAADLVTFAKLNLQRQLTARGVTLVGEYCSTIAESVVDTHLKLEELINSPAFPNPEKKGYAELTIRDLMKWCDGVAAVVAAQGVHTALPTVGSQHMNTILFNEG